MPSPLPTPVQDLRDAIDLYIKETIEEAVAGCPGGPALLNSEEWMYSMNYGPGARATITGLVFGFEQIEAVKYLRHLERQLDGK